MIDEKAIIRALEGCPDCGGMASQYVKTLIRRMKNGEFGFKKEPFVCRTFSCPATCTKCFESQIPTRPPCSKPYATFECFSWCMANHVCKYETRGD